jgi:hypothetical protein
MSEVSKSTTIKAPASEVWKTVSDFNGLPKYLSLFVDSKMEGSGVGAIRTITTGDGAVIVERCDKMDEATYTHVYSIVESPLQLDNYVATVQLKEMGESQCELTWSSVFDPKGDAEKDLIELIDGAYQQAFDGIKSIHEG